ncbi:metallophosphoesterase family protein [Photobacterium sp.]|uniref:metallophosphoesterase family protein n=1 Tax=Photobacterium sp. TaxID=660 RepID=UPI00299E2A5D|nr:metallophosphoesterase [Photobacterium sp.]MDX1301628.1 metallophosphoesterase [Photobacterium sp.]
MDRPGWSSGNSVVIIVTGTGERVAEAFDGVPSAAPLLHIEFSVGDGNTIPTVSIMEPVDNSNFAVGDTVIFTTTADDAEDGDLSENVVWTSDLDGAIGAGALLSISNLSRGAHAITASVTDSGAITVTDQITVTIGEEVATLDVRVAASTDDAEELTSGRIRLTSGDLDLVYDGSDQTIGLRFSAVTIPQGASIERAYVQLQTDETSSDTTLLTIEAENTDDAATFTLSNGNVSTRQRTTNTLSWFPPAWTTVGEVGPDQQTPDIAPIIQEIVDRPGWSSGNALAIIISGTGYRVAEAFDGEPDAAPLLHVEYSGGEDKPAGSPVITSFMPASAQTAMVVEITGNNFSGAKNVSFNGISSQFRIASGDTIYATVPPGETSGPITVSDLTGSAISVTEFSLVPSPNVLVGAGDIGECDGIDNEATARLLDVTAGTVFTAGDNVHGDGTLQEFADCYDSSWGRHKPRTRPTSGNHEYQTVGAADYFSYFGPAAGEPGKGYYSYDIGEWHIIVLNSECHKIGGCDNDSAQGQWLQADLLQHTNTCTLAYWHQPRFSSGRIGNNPELSDFWQILFDAGAEVVISGHSHGYERFAPQDADGAIDTLQGIRQFVVGTGGVNVVTIPESEIAPNSEVHEGDTHGVIKFTLNPGSYEWEFIPVEGKVFSDSGSASCH